MIRQQLNRYGRRGGLLVTALLLVAVALPAPAAQAYYGWVGSSYFEHASAPNFTVIPGNDQGSHSLPGSVIPNYWGEIVNGRQTGQGDASGAIGDEAMGCYVRATHSWVPNCDRKQHLFDRLHWDYLYGNPWEKAGSAEVVNNMLGRAWGTGSRTIPDTDWTELYKRFVQNPNVTMEWRGGANGYPRALNTGGVIANGRYDAVRFDYGDNTPVDAWEFKDRGVTVLALEIACANGLGDFPGFASYNPQYQLTPSLSIQGRPTTIESGAAVNLQSSISNNGGVNSRPAQWQLNKIVTQPGGSVSNAGGGTSAQVPCGYFTGPKTTCKGIGNGDSGPGGYPRGNTNLGVTNSGSLDYPVGTRVCFALSIQPRAYNSDEWYHTALQCVTVGVRPKVQVWGGDLAVRGAITTSTTTKGSGTFGSWAEYGVFSVGANNHLASGSGLATAAIAWDNLTFANTPAPGSYAPAASFRAQPTIASFFTAIADQGGAAYNAGGSLDSNSFATGSPVVVRKASGTLTLSGQSLSRGRSVVIVADTVKITGDLTYKGDGLKSQTDIPQLVIIANNINIEQNVSTVDAWLVASGTIDTCSNAGGGLSSKVCGTVLTVHGPVVAGKLKLNRTGGSGSGGASGDPAERFDLRPDAYLWAQLVASGNGKAQTVDTIELPPRF